MLICSIILPSIVKIFLTVAELCSGNELLMPARTPADIHHFNNQIFPSENLVKKWKQISTFLSNIFYSLVFCIFHPFPLKYLFHLLVFDVTKPWCCSRKLDWKQGKFSDKMTARDPKIISFTNSVHLKWHHEVLITLHILETSELML